MSRETIIAQGKTVYQSVSNLDRATLTNNPGNLQPWNQLTIDDFMISFDDMRRL